MSELDSNQFRQRARGLVQAHFEMRRSRTAEGDSPAKTVMLSQDTLVSLQWKELSALEELLPKELRGEGYGAADSGRDATSPAEPDPQVSPKIGARTTPTHCMSSMAYRLRRKDVQSRLRWYRARMELPRSWRNLANMGSVELRRACLGLARDLVCGALYGLPRGELLQWLTPFGGLEAQGLLNGIGRVKSPWPEELVQALLAALKRMDPKRHGDRRLSYLGRLALATTLHRDTEEMRQLASRSARSNIFEMLPDLSPLQVSKRASRRPLEKLVNRHFPGLNPPRGSA